MTEQSATDSIAQTAGELLAQARSARKLSVADVAGKLRIAPRQIEALEANDYERLPGHTIARGFVRNYARLLQLDPDVVLEAFEKHSPKQADARISLPNQKVQFSEAGNSHHNRSVLWLTLGILLITAIGYALWRWELRNSTTPQPAAIAPAPKVVTPVVPEPTASAPVPVPEITLLPSNTATAISPTTGQVSNPATDIANPPIVVAEQVVHLAFEAPAWVEARDESGKVVWQKTHGAGSEADITLAPPLAFTIGNAAKVKMTYNGESFDLAPHIQGSIARFKLER